MKKAISILHDIIFFPVFIVQYLFEQTEWYKKLLGGKWTLVRVLGTPMGSYWRRHSDKDNAYPWEVCEIVDYSFKDSDILDN